MGIVILYPKTFSSGTRKISPQKKAFWRNLPNYFDSQIRWRMHYVPSLLLAIALTQIPKMAMWLVWTGLPIHESGLQLLII